LRAEETVDPRYAYNLEVGGTVGSASTFGDSATTQLLLGGFVTFAAPVGENRKVTVGLRGLHGSGNTSELQGPGKAPLSLKTTGWFETLVAGYRLVTDFAPFQTRLDLQVAADLSRFIVESSSADTRFSIGPRVAVGGLYSLSRGWRVGIELSAAFLAPNPRAQFEANPLVTYSW
jgi:hypothetical protein